MRVARPVRWGLYSINPNAFVWQRNKRMVLPNVVLANEGDQEIPHFGEAGMIQSG